VERGREANLASAAALPFPDVVEWVREGRLHLQWRDRAGL